MEFCSLTTGNAQASRLIFMLKGVNLDMRKHIFILKESCQSYVLETKSEMKTTLAKVFPSGVPSFLKGSAGSHFILILLNENEQICEQSSFS